MILKSSLLKEMYIVIEASLLLLLLLPTFEWLKRNGGAPLFTEVSSEAIRHVQCNPIFNIITDQTKDSF